MRQHLSNAPAYHSSSTKEHKHVEPAHAPSAFRASGIRDRIQAQMVSRRKKIEAEMTEMVLHIHTRMVATEEMILKGYEGRERDMMSVLGWESKREAREGDW